MTLQLDNSKKAGIPKEVNMNTYEEYLNDGKGNILKMEDALEIYTGMMDSIKKSSFEEKMEFWQDFLEQALKYTTIRCKWEFMAREEMIAADSKRTDVHNALISLIDILARNLGKDGTDVSWRDKLGGQRARIGDFACFVIYMTGISNR